LLNNLVRERLSLFWLLSVPVPFPFFCFASTFAPAFSASMLVLVPCWWLSGSSCTVAAALSCTPFAVPWPQQDDTSTLDLFLEEGTSSAGFEVKKSEGRR
jgi:hypothetical protein